MIIIQHYSLTSTEDACVVAIKDEAEVNACIISFICNDDSFVFEEEDITLFLKKQNFNSGKNIFTQSDYLEIDNNEDRFDFLLDNLTEIGLVELLSCVTKSDKKVVIHRNVNTN